MGVALLTQSVTGEQSDYPVINLEEALIIFTSMPWEKEMAAWEQMPEGERENRKRAPGSSTRCWRG